MDRDQARELLSEYLDGELEPEERAALEEHLAGDKVLRDELDALRQTLHVLTALPQETPPEDFLQKVRTKLKRQRKSVLDVSFGMERKIPFEAVSMVLIGILLALYLLLVALPGDRETLGPQVPDRIQRDGGVDAGDSGPASLAPKDSEEKPSRLEAE